MMFRTTPALESVLSEIALDDFCENAALFLLHDVFKGKVPPGFEFQSYIRQALERARRFGLMSGYGLVCCIIMELACGRPFASRPLADRSTGSDDETGVLLGLFNETLRQKGPQWEPAARQQLVDLLKSAHRRFADRGQPGSWYHSQEKTQDFLLLLQACKLDVRGFPVSNFSVYAAESGLLTSAPPLSASGPGNPTSPVNAAQSAPPTWWLPVAAGRSDGITLSVQAGPYAAGDASTALNLADANGMRTLDPTRALSAQMDVSGLRPTAWPDIAHLNNTPVAIVADAVNIGQSADAEQASRRIRAVIKAYDATQHLRRLQFDAWSSQRAETDGPRTTQVALKGSQVHLMQGSSQPGDTLLLQQLGQAVSEGIGRWLDQLAAHPAVSGARWVSESQWLAGHLTMAHGLRPGAVAQQAPVFCLGTHSDLNRSGVDIRWSGLFEQFNASALIHLDCVATLPFGLNKTVEFALDTSLNPESLPRHTCKLMLLASIEPVVQVGKPVLGLIDSVAGELEVGLEIAFCQVTQRLVPHFWASATAIGLTVVHSNGLLGEQVSHLDLAPAGPVFDWMPGV